MNKKLFTTLVSAAAFGLCVMVSTQANAQGQKDSVNAGDKYGYNLHNGKRDPFTDGARVNDRRNPFTDGARVNDRRDAFTDGAHGATALDLAGRDLTGVSAAPAYSGDTSGASA